MNGTEIKALRDKLGLNQTDFARLMGVHPMTISRWERGVPGVAPSPYQVAFMTEFERASNKKAIDEAVRTALIGAGIVAAIFILLKAAQGD